MKVNRKGVTLIELIGALVLLGILVGLITTTIAIFIRSTNESVTESQIQTEGLLLVRTIENRISAFGPNGIDPGGCNDAPEQATNCLRLQRLTVDGDTFLEVYFLNNQLFVGVGNPVVVNNLGIHAVEIIPEPPINNNVVLRLNVQLKINLNDPDELPITFRSSNIFRVE